MDNKTAIDEFNIWAQTGKDRGMEHGHASSVDRMVEILYERYDTKNIRSMLDLGCGNGWMLRKIRAKLTLDRAVGIDGASFMIDKANKIDPNGNYLINSFDINYLSSLQLFISKGVRDYSAQKGSKILAIGSPKFSKSELTNQFLDDQNVYRNLVSKIEANQNIDQEFVYLGYTEWDSLPGAIDELNTISEIFNDVNILTRSDANELSVKVLCDLNDYDIIHFATHSITIDDIPQASSIILSSSQTTVDDGYLNISEISKLNIKSSFINLASCESGVGEILPGQGIYSFTQAFEYAGAQSVLVSLWPIDDQSTSIFMTNFYSKIASGYLYNHALAEVKREFISGKYGEEYKKPYYWAPFVYYGK